MAFIITSRSMTRSLASFVFVGALAASLAGCAGKNDNGNGSDNGNGQEASPNPGPVAQPAEPSRPADTTSATGATGHEDESSFGVVDNAGAADVLDANALFDTSELPVPENAASKPCGLYYGVWYAGLGYYFSNCVNHDQLVKVDMRAALDFKKCVPANKTRFLRPRGVRSAKVIADDC